MAEDTLDIQFDFEKPQEVSMSGDRDYIKILFVRGFVITSSQGVPINDNTALSAELPPQLFDPEETKRIGTSIQSVTATSVVLTVIMTFGLQSFI